MKIDFPQGPPGVHPPTAALARMLDFKGVKNPVTDQPYSESLLLGIGGGVDIGYLLYQFPHLKQPLLVLGFRNQWNNTRAFFEDLTSRLYLSVQFLEFNTKKEAEESLQETLDARKTAVVWVDKAHLPYHHMPDHLKGLINYQVAVYARDGRLWRLYLDDLCTHPIQLREKLFTSARSNLSQNNYLMMVFTKADNISSNELREAIIEGIRSCANNLTNPMKAIGISNLETWSEKLIDRHDRQGWSQVFKNRKGLFIALRTIYESIKLNGTKGFALRKLYAEFLHESAGILNNAALNTITGQYLQLANHWSNLAENALPSKVLEFARVKNLLNKKYQAYREYKFETFTRIVKDLQGMEEKLSTDFPLDEHETYQLFRRLSSQVQLISELEYNAAYRLRDITQQE